MIKYVIRAKRNPVDKTVKFYPQIAPATPVSLAQVVRRVEKRSTVASADVKAVLDALQYEVVDALQNGNTVRLGDLGSFRLTIKAKGSATSDEAKKAGADAITAVKVQFTKSPAMRAALSSPAVEFGLQSDIAND